MLVASVVSGAHVHIGHFHLHLPMHIRSHAVGHHPGADTALSLPSIAGFIGAFGFGGAVAPPLLPGRSATRPLPLGVAAAPPPGRAAAPLRPGRSATPPSLRGFAAALPTGWAAARLTRAAMEMSTDATPERSDVIGSLGTVIRAIPTGGYGEVRVAFLGQQMKYHARA